MQKPYWEYKTRMLQKDLNREFTEDVLNTEGANGWELVNIVYTDCSSLTAVFKRHRLYVGKHD